MGWWRTVRGLGGDDWADEMDGAMHRLAAIGVGNTKLYGRAEHQITMAEFADLVEFCSRGHLVVTVRHPEDADRPLSKLSARGVETYANGGQIHCSEPDELPLNQELASARS